MRSLRFLGSAVLLAALSASAGCSCDPAGAESSGARAKARGFLKGQLHAHSWGSLDSDAPTEQVVRWYSQRGYDFLVVTDHNRLTRASGTPSMLVLPGVELTINLATCEPPPEDESCLLHVNALIPERPLPFEPWFPLRGSFRREELFGQEIAEVQRMGAVGQLNHPNFHYAADAPAIVALAARGLTLMEIANQSSDARNDGDATHPSTEALWDAVLSKGAHVLGTATDDAHDYFDEPGAADRAPWADTGDRGWVMVHAEKTAKSIRDALARGDFYATTGILFDRIELSAERVELEIAGDRVVWLEAIGQGGTVYRAQAGRAMSFDPRSFGSSYIRVRATDAKGRHAWTQAVFVNPRSP